jgi:copper chaperone CopZ
LPGIGEITGDLATNTLIVTFDPAQVTEEAIVEAIESTGFTVKSQLQP